MKRGDVVLVVARVLVCPMSSEVTEFRRLRPIVDPSPGNGLRLRSQTMTDKISEIRRDRVRRVLGKLDPDASERFDGALLVVLGLAR